MINKLPSVFTGTGEVKGFKFRKRIGTRNAYLYEVWTEESNSPHFEVFVKKTVPLCIDFATKTYSDTDSKEVYPKGKDFGSGAWCYRNFDKALKKIADLDKNKAEGE